MLNRSERLFTSDDFRRVGRQGRKKPVPGALVSFLENGQPHSRWGFIVSKAVGSAVVRNLVKRRLRAAARVLVSEIGGLDVVVRAQQGAPAMTVNEWVAVLRSALTRGSR